MERFTFTVGKLDAGMAILIGERAHLIEFPSLLLPPGITSGSIVNISVDRNTAAEEGQAKEFWSLQDSILQEYGLNSPQPPQLKLRHVTQTSVTLEWPSLNLAKAKLRSLEILKNGTRLATIPNPTANTSTKLSSLQMNEEYTFQLILKTTAGTYPSNVVRVRTHTLNDTSGISVCFGTVEDQQLLDQAKVTLEKMGASWTDKIQIDTTQFVCTTPMAMGQEEGQRNGYGSSPSGATAEYQKAMQLSLPVVQPQWILACYGEKKLVPVSSYQLGSAPIQSFTSAPFSRTSIAPGSPSRQSSMTAAAKSASIQRAPSPETIARMSINTSSADNGSNSSSPKTHSVPKMASQQSDPSPERSSEGSRPKSPKPESVGKLDRAFKFPTGSSPTSGSNAASPVNSQGPSSALVQSEQQIEEVVNRAVAASKEEVLQEEGELSALDASIPAPVIKDEPEIKVAAGNATPAAVEFATPPPAATEEPASAEHTSEVVEVPTPPASNGEETSSEPIPLVAEAQVPPAPAEEGPSIEEDRNFAEPVAETLTAQDSKPALPNAVVVPAPQAIATALSTSVVAELPVSDSSALSGAVAVLEEKAGEETQSLQLPELQTGDSEASVGAKKKKGKKKKAGGKKTDEATGSPKEVDDSESVSKDVD